MTLEGKRLTVDGRRTFCRYAEGPNDVDGPAVILLHGQGVSSDFLAPSGEAFGRRFPTWVPDQPGFGRSEGPTHALDVDGLADFVVHFMDAAGLQRAVIVGTSFGCQVAVACALRHADRVERIVLQGPATAPQDRGRLRLVRLWRENGKQEPSELGRLLSEYHRAGYRRVYETFEHYRRYPLEAGLRCVTRPALVVRGELDRLVPQFWAEQVARLLPQGRLVVIPGAAHTMSRFWGEELARAAEPFVRGEDGQPSI